MIIKQVLLCNAWFHSIPIPVQHSGHSYGLLILHIFSIWMDAPFAAAAEVAGSIRTAQQFRFDKQGLKNYTCSLLEGLWCENVNYI